MNNVDLLNEYLEEFFLPGENLGQPKWKKVRAKLKTYMRSYGETSEMRDVFVLIDMYESERNNNDFASLQKIIAPLLERLGNAESLSFFDTRLLVQTVGYAQTYKQVQKLAKKALQSLEQYNGEKTHLKLVVHLNIAVRLLQMHYYDIEDMDSYDDTLSEMFDEHVGKVSAICTQGDFPLYKAVMLIRKGLFEQDYDVIDENLTILRNSGNKAVWKMMQDEVNKYNAYAGNAISVEQFNRLVGHNLKKLRKLRGISVEDFAKMVGVTPPYIRLIERGMRGMLTHKMYKMANILNVKWEMFFQDTSAVPSIESNDERQRICKIITNLNDEDFALFRQIVGKFIH